LQSPKTRTQNVRILVRIFHSHRTSFPPCLPHTTQELHKDVGMQSVHRQHRKPAMKIHLLLRMRLSGRPSNYRPWS
jgi:hypothetical protein